jgi:drug/metabolite transporter (DMT)-like permease
VTERPAADGWRVHLALVGAQIGFALFPIFGKLALRSIPPMALGAFRVVAASLLLGGLRRFSGAPPIARADRGAIFLYALLGVSINQILFLLGLSLSTAIEATILMTLIPVFTLAAAAMLGRERFRGRAAIAMALAGTGALLLLRVERFQWSDAHLRGDVLLVTNAASYSLYLVLSRPILSRYPVMSVVSGVFAFGAAPIVLAGIPELTSMSFGAVTATGWASAAGVVVCCTVLPYFWSSWALARTAASRVAFYSFVQPLIASFLAVAVLGERLSGRTGLAALLILSGLAVSVARGRLPARPIP